MKEEKVENSEKTNIIMGIIGIIIAIIGIPLERSAFATLHENPSLAGIKLAVFLFGYIIALVAVKQQLSIKNKV